MPTSVALTPHFESLTQQLVSSGRYNNVSEVVRDGLRLLESRVQEETAKLAALRDAAKLGFGAIERGESLALRNDQDIAGFVQLAGLKVKAAAGATSAALKSGRAKKSA
jgi:antitoxin ParD1/3/4